MVTADVEKIVAAAHYGQVETVLLAEDTQIWGTFDAAQGVVEQAESEAGETGQELLERTAVHTFLQGGSVFFLPQAEMPEAAAAVALLRAPVHTLAS